MTLSPKEKATLRNNYLRNTSFVTAKSGDTFPHWGKVNTKV
jgi:hypothetical protein